MPFQIFVSAQTEYNLTLTNVTRPNQKSIEFDVYAVSSNEIFNLIAYQCSFLFDNSFANGGNLSFTYIEGSSHFTNPPVYGVSVREGSNNTESEITFASMVGSDIIAHDSILVGRFRLQNTTAFSSSPLSIAWNFEGPSGSMVIGDSFQNITLPINFYISQTGQVRSKHNHDQPSRNDQVTEYFIFNYPNPFNPVTKIRYGVPNTCHVNLKVFDVLGREVIEMVNEIKTAGIYEAIFNAEDLSSGTYFYRIQAGEYTKVKKMNVVK